MLAHLDPSTSSPNATTRTTTLPTRTHPRASCASAKPTPSSATRTSALGTTVTICASTRTTTTTLPIDPVDLTTAAPAPPAGARHRASVDVGEPTRARHRAFTAVEGGEYMGRREELRTSRARAGRSHGIRGRRLHRRGRHRQREVIREIAGVHRDMHRRRRRGVVPADLVD